MKMKNQITGKEFDFTHEMCERVLRIEDEMMKKGHPQNMILTEKGYYYENGHIRKLKRVKEEDKSSE